MSYTPRPDSNSAKAIEAIQRLGPMRPADLARAIDVKGANLFTAVKPAIKHGLLIRRDNLYALPDGAPVSVAEPARGKSRRPSVDIITSPDDVQRPAAVAALWDDGDIIVHGAVVGENSLCLEDGAARQLHRFLTRIYGPVEA